MSNKRLFDIFKFKKPNAKSTMVPVVANTDQDSEDIDNDLSSSFSVASSSNVVSYSSEFGSDNNSTTSSNNALIVDELFDLGDLQSGPVRPILKVSYLLFITLNQYNAYYCYSPYFINYNFT